MLSKATAHGYDHILTAELQLGRVNIVHASGIRKLNPLFPKLAVGQVAIGVGRRGPLTFRRAIIGMSLHVFQ